MADRDPPPAKPKPGSLRDRIAAFEQKPASTAGHPPPPAPRPKPGNIHWKPKVVSPPSSPPAKGAHEGSSDGPVRGKSGGMSAADAKESIGVGGSLKERMAALQGRGGFGAPPPAPLPKPATEKPKWKPPPVVSPPTPDADEHTSDAGPTEVVHERTDAIVVDAPVEHHDDDEKTAADDESELQQNDPEEEERQRRAAIAARMARLGGARVGMGPPVFGRKPPVKKPDLQKKSSEEDAHPAVSPIKTDIGHTEG